MENINKYLIRDEETIKEDKKNILIAEKAREVLKNKMLLTQKALSRSEVEKITFTEFASKVNSLAKTLEMMEKDDCGRLELENEYYAFMDKYANAVVLKEYEIDELLRYVKQSIMRLGVAKNKEKYTCSEFVKYALLMLRDRHRELFKETDLELEKWIDLFCSSDTAGFLPQNGILFTLKGYGSEYFTIKERGKKLFCMSSDGVTTINEYIDDLNNLLLDDLFIGYITKDNRRILTLLSKAKGYYYPVFFHEDDEHNYDDRKKENATNVISLKHALTMMGQKHLIEPLYDKKVLEYIMTVISECKGVIIDTTTMSSSLNTDEEIKESELYVLLTVTSQDEYIRLNGTLLRSKDASDIKIADDKCLAIRLNDLLSLAKPKIFRGIMPDVIVSQLKEDAYDPKKLEYIMACLVGHCIPLTDITITNSKNENKKLNL